MTNFHMLPLKLTANKPECIALWLIRSKLWSEDRRIIVVRAIWVLEPCQKEVKDKELEGLIDTMLKMRFNNKLTWVILLLNNSRNSRVISLVCIIIIKQTRIITSLGNMAWLRIWLRLGLLDMAQLWVELSVNDLMKWLAAAVLDKAKECTSEFSRAILTWSSSCISTKQCKRAITNNTPTNTTTQVKKRQFHNNLPLDYLGSTKAHALFQPMDLSEWIMSTIQVNINSICFSNQTMQQLCVWSQPILIAPIQLFAVANLSQVFLIKSDKPLNIFTFSTVLNIKCFLEIFNKSFTAK